MNKKWISLIERVFIVLLAVLVFVGMKGCILSPSPLSPPIDGAKGSEGSARESVSTDDVFPPEDDVNGEKPREVPIGREEGVNRLKENPVPSEGPAEEDKAEEN